MFFESVDIYIYAPEDGDTCTMNWVWNGEGVVVVFSGIYAS